MNKKTIAVTLFVSMAACAADDTLRERIAKDKVTMVADDDPAMARAFEKARASLDEFLRKARSPSDGESGFALKVAIRQGKEVEYFWITPFKQDEDRFVGIINNDPDIVSNVHIGQRYKFSRSDIFDWTYAETKGRKKMKGNFTACALLTHEPPDQVEEFLRTYGLECEPL